MLTSVLFPELSLSHTVSQFWPDETWFDGGSKIRSEKIQAHNSILRNQCEQCERRPHGDPSVNNTYSVKEYDNVQSVKDTTMYKVATYDNVQSCKIRQCTKFQDYDNVQSCKNTIMYKVAYELSTRITKSPQLCKVPFPWSYKSSQTNPTLLTQSFSFESPTNT